MTSPEEKLRLELLEITDRLRSNGEIPEAEAERLLDRVDFLREQIDLVRKEMEQGIKSSVAELRELEEEISRERNP